MFLRYHDDLAAIPAPDKLRTPLDRGVRHFGKAGASGRCLPDIGHGKCVSDNAAIVARSAWSSS